LATLFRFFAEALCNATAFSTLVEEIITPNKVSFPAQEKTAGNAGGPVVI